MNEKWRLGIKDTRNSKENIRYNNNYKGTFEVIYAGYFLL